MKAYRVRVSRPARDDLVDIAAYLADKIGEAAAEAYVRRLGTSIDTLRGFPHRGIHRDDIRPGLRALAVKPYLILYRVGRADVDVLRVLHGRRDIRRAFDEG